MYTYKNSLVLLIFFRKCTVGKKLTITNMISNSLRCQLIILLLSITPIFNILYHYYAQCPIIFCINFKYMIDLNNLCLDEWG